MERQSPIAFVCHPYHRGGVTRWMADAAMAYGAMGREVYFLTVAPKKEFFSAKGKETLLQLLSKSNKVKILSQRVGFEFEFGTPEYRAFVYKKLIRQLPQSTPLILSDDHAVWEAATFMQMAYPVVGVLHADEDHYYNLAEQYYSRVDLLVCVSRRVHETTRKRVPAFPAERIYTIPCGINLPTAIDVPKPDNVLQLVYVGRVSNFQKRVGDLVKIAGALVKENISFHLDIIGDGDARKPLEQMCKAEGLEDKVSFTGWLSQAEVGKRLAASDLLLLTSDFEGTPIAMMEALAAGCGMVGTRVSGIEDYEHHPLAAECLGVFATGNIGEAVQRIKNLAAVPANARKRSARKMAEAEFSMQVCLERYDAAMATLSQHTDPPPLSNLPPGRDMYSRLLSLARYVKMSFTKR